jgi:hypothetical protein
MLDIRLAPDGWGAALPDIMKVLISAEETLTVFFPTAVFAPVEVSRGYSGPITHFQRGVDGAIRVELDVEGRKWDQFALQFGHELCHILCGYAKYDNLNAWFEQALCEAASLFVLGQMAEKWVTNAPYPNWSDYPPKLQNYRTNRIEEARLPEGVSIGDFLAIEEESLRSDANQHSQNVKVGAALLPLFEAHPQNWEVVGNLNAERGARDRSFGQYLSDWSRSSLEKHRAFIRQIAGLLAVSIDHDE